MNTLSLSQRATVFLIDDDPSLLRALSRLVRSAGFESQSFPSPAEFLNAVSPLTRGCVVLDMHMPGTNGLKVQEQLTLKGCSLPVIFLTAYGDLPSCVDAMKSGALDFLSKPVKDRELLEAVEKGFLRCESRFLEMQKERETRLRAATLSHRENEVFSLVATGLPNKVIAERLGICEKTTKVHRGHVMQKMSAGSLAELVLMAVQLGLIPGR